ncbi:unnamed protein product [Ectocarpus fasciculatus]
MAGKGGHGAYGKDGPGAAAFRVQHQIRQNAQDMQEYLTDLGSWEKSIKKKDKQLSRKGMSESPFSRNGRATPDTGTPPIRSAGSTVPISSGPALQPSQPTQKLSANSLGCRNDGAGGRPHINVNAANGGGATGDSGKAKSSMSAAGHTYDKGYGKWAKFDIDAALRSVDQEQEEGVNDKRRSCSNSDSDTDSDKNQETPRLTPATMVDHSCSRGLRRPPPPNHTVAPTSTSRSSQSPKDLEKEERERGNEKFGQGDFKGAVKSYTRCVGMNSKSSLAFSNRAMANLKLKEFGKAESDADAALRVDPRHVKSLQRRAVARNALGKHRAALGDLQTAAEIDPTSKQVRKDLSKTLETLKAVVRRAPKTHVRVGSFPLPAPKPRGHSQPGTATQEGLPPAVTIAASTVSATNHNASVTGDEETAAPYSSVLQESTDKHATNEANVYSYQARTIVEELPDEAEATPATPVPTPRAPTNAVSSVQSVSLPAASIAVVAQNERGGDAVPRSSGRVERDVAVDPAAETPKIDTVEGSLTKTTAPGAATPSKATDVAAAHEVRPAVSTDVASKTGPPALSLVDVGAKQVAKKASAGGEGNNLSRGAHPVEEEAIYPSLEAKTEDRELRAPTQTLQQVGPPTPAPACRATAHAPQLPTTGYQFESMWRSTDGSPEARLELLRAVPPSTIAKIFRRTPIEVELLGGVLQEVGKAFLPRRPATALRWLKSLSKASRFSMTVALLGEEDGRAAAREVLRRLEAAPLTKVDPKDVDALRKQFSC